MDRSLLLLMKLRLGGLLRRWKKTVMRPKGIVMAVVTALIFVPWIVSAIMTARVDVKPPLEQIRRFGPLGLFAFTVGSLLLSSGEQFLYYSPAEVSFLFAGPYRRRQVLGYKLVTMVLLCLISSVFFAFSSAMMSPRLLSAFVGSFLILVFVQALQMIVGLAGGTLGALAWSRRRRLMLAGFVVVVGLAVVSAGRGLMASGPLGALQEVERSPVARAVLTPFRWYIFTFTSDRAWPELARWAALAGAVDLGLIALIFALDASYLEAASGASARRFEKLQRLGGGGGGLRSMGKRPTGRFRFRPPDPPWWGGVGPNFWRQMTTAIGDPVRLLSILLLLSLVPVMMIIIGSQDARQAESLPYVAMGMVAWMSIVLSFLIPYDFRGDVDLMEELKALPISPTRLAMGQLLAPTLIAGASQFVAMLVILVGMGGVAPMAWAFAAFLIPVNFLFFAVENLLFLWFPSRIVAGQFDVVAVGRQILLMLGKMLGLAVGVGASALVGVLAFFLGGRALAPALVAAWVALVAVALALLPLVGHAFSRFDVSRDIPA